MSPPSTGHVNFLISSFGSLEDEIKEMFMIDEEIGKLISNLKGLKAKRMKKERMFLKEVRCCKRNYGDVTYDRFSECVVESISYWNESYFMKSTTLDQLKRISETC